MRPLKLIPVLFSATIIAGCASTPTDPTYRNQQNILGTWNCTSEVTDVENGVRTTANFESSYVRSGISNSVGNLTIEIKGFPALNYAVTTSATWEIQRNLLIETTNDVKLKSLNHPNIAEQLDIEEMIPKNIGESYNILYLGSSLLRIKSELDGSTVTCKK